MTEDMLQNCRKVDELLRRIINRLCSVLFQQRLHREPERERESNREAIYSKFSYLDMLHIRFGKFKFIRKTKPCSDEIPHFANSMIYILQTDTNASIGAGPAQSCHSGWCKDRHFRERCHNGLLRSIPIVLCARQCPFDALFTLPLLPSQLESLCPCQQLYATCRRGDLCPRLGSIPSSVPVVVFLKATV